MCIKNPNQLPTLLQKSSFDVILLDMNFSAGVNSGNEGIYWLNQILTIDPEAVVIMITAYGDIDLAVKSVKEGAVDFVLKPWENDKLLATVRSGCMLRQSKRKIKKLMVQKNHLQRQAGETIPEIIGDSAEMKNLFKLINKVSSSNANILLMGENGTGKELIARKIHYLSERKDEIFLQVDLGTIPENLFESEMFGHDKGAFTDARQDKMGRFEAASGGTIFLDEISNLPLALQAKLLTVIQNYEITRLGSNEAIPVDIRLISATNADLKKMIGQGAFRKDLYYRLNTIQIEIPPLRAREGDIQLLAQHFLKIYSRRYEKDVNGIDKKVLKRMISYSWPGNVREIQHVIEKAVILCEGNTIGEGDITLSLATTEKPTGGSGRTLAEIEKEAIQEALKNNEENIYKTAKELGLARQTLYNKIEKYGL
jgi:DNA-binding NtrC family response regulator